MPAAINSRAIIRALGLTATLAVQGTAFAGKERIDPTLLPLASTAPVQAAAPRMVPASQVLSPTPVAGTQSPTGEAQLAQDDRRRPGEMQRRPDQRPQRYDPSAAAPPQPNLPREFIPVPDRWRIIDAVGVVPKWWDPYNQNYLKGDRPVYGKDWFINLAAISDTVIEPRLVPTGISPNSTSRASTNDVFGDGEQLLINENVILSLSLIKGDTAYRPPDIELRLTPVFNFNRTEVEELSVVHRDPARGKTRDDGFLGIQEAFFDYHIRNVSDRYDFDSIRIGIQPFSTDFRGFLFQDNQLGVRLFGNRDNNIFQYNLAWFRRLEKDTNSGLNDVSRATREDDVFIANLYVQDLPVLGFVSQLTLVHNRNRDGDGFFYNDNKFLERPASFGDERFRDYDVTYVGFNGDGHFGRANLTLSTYYAWGEDDHNQIASAAQGKKSDIRAWFLAAEPSIDFDWIRLRGSLLYASGDSDPFDDKEEGFDAIFENPQFAGGDTSYWIRQGIPLIGGGGVALTQRNGVLASLRTSKEHGQSNFNNPGLLLYGFGGDFDLLPELRVSFNVNRLMFDDTSNLEVLRNQGEIDESIGVDASVSLIYRPFMSQNVVFRLSGAVLFADDGFKDLFASSADPSGFTEDRYYSVLGNLILTF
jgi:hypothetical protein